MSVTPNMRPVLALVSRSRPHLSASQLRLIGSALQANRSKSLELAASGIADLPDAELAQRLLVIARRMGAQGFKP
jgi:hypothetical protein